MLQSTFTFIIALFLLHSNPAFAQKSEGAKTTNGAEQKANKALKDKVKASKTPINSKKGKTVTITIETNYGTMEAELWPDKAPDTVANFLKYIEEKFYDDTIFHRVISEFMIQGGGFTSDMKQKNTHAPIKNEATNGLSNTKGTLAMARTMDINSATSQFFINHADNAFLNHRGQTGDTFGYAVFGKVTKGEDVLEKIAKVPTDNKGMHQNVPVEPVVIKSIRKK